MSSITRKFQQPQIPRDSQYNEYIIRQYQANLRVFLQKVDEQVSELIQKYEGQIKKLKRQNTSLRQKLSRYQTSSFSNPQQFRQTISEFKIQNISPVKTQKDKVLLKTNNFNGTTAGKSDFFGRSNLKSYLQYQADDLSSSRFEVEKNKKKMQQQNILSSLEAGKTNLGLNTSKMFDLLGKSQIKNQPSESEQEEQEVKSTEEKKPSLNASLSSACESLDNSFHGKRSKKKNELKRKQKQRIKQMRLQQARKHYKDRKQQGLKNLLKTIRKNVSSTQQKPPQPLKSLKIANSAYETDETATKKLKKQCNEVNKSKVLIDPNPVDMQKNRNRNINRNRQKQQSKLQSQMNTNSQKKPISILKSNSNILSKSLLNSSSSLH